MAYTAETFFNISDQEKLFNEFITPGVIGEIRSRSKIFDKTRKDWKNIDTEGLYAKQKMLMAGSQSTGASNDGKYPEAQQSTPGYSTIKIKRAQMFTIAFEGMALEAARGKGIAMKPMDFERKGLFITMADDLSRQLIMDGSGYLCQLVTCGADPTTVVKNAFFADATKFLKADRRLEVHTVGDAIGAGKAASSYSGALYVASKTNKTTFELSANCNVSGDVDDYYFNYKAYCETEAYGQGEMMGLMGIISEGNPPQPNDVLGLQGLPVASYPEWKAHVFDNPLGTGGTDRDLTEDLFVQALQAVEEFAPCDVILVSPGVYREWLILLQSYKTLPNTKVMWGGWSGLPFYYDGREIPVVMDKFVPDGCALFLSNENLTLHVLTPGLLTWEQGFGASGGMLQKVANYNRYKAEGHIFANLGTGLRKGFALISDISEPA
jgi:hypothetical protein